MPASPGVGRRHGLRALDAYLDGRTRGPLFLAADGVNRYPYQSAFSQIRRLARAAGIPPPTGSPHIACATPSPPKPSPSAPPPRRPRRPRPRRPRTTRRYDRNRHNLDRSPTYLLARTLITDHQ
jgi:integrase/recombinase XerD